MASNLAIDRSRAWASPILLSLALLTLFVLPLMHQHWLNRAFTIAFSALFLSSAFYLKGARSMLFNLAVAIVLVTGTASLLKNSILSEATRMLQFLFFVLLVARFIGEIAGSNQVTRLVIMDAVTAYLLLGMAFSVMVLFTDNILPGAYTHALHGSTARGPNPDIGNALYYTFITFTTTGYGDISPVHAVSKTLAIAMAVSGQLYVAIILALLVGKFSSRQSSANNN